MQNANCPPEADPPLADKLKNAKESLQQGALN